MSPFATISKIVPIFFSISLYASDPAAKNEHDAEKLTAVVGGPVVEIRDTPLDFKMPMKLWDSIMSGEKKSGAHGEKKDAHGDDQKEKKEDLLIVWVPIEVTFQAKREKILVHEWVQYKFPRGGGTLDLSQIAIGERGTFFLNFNLGEFTNRQGVKIYFISNAKKRKLDGEVYGAGCNVYFDVTDAVQKSLSGEGLRFNITDNRHISALSGHFVFVQAGKDKVYLSQVEFGDSKNRDYLCKN